MIKKIISKLCIWIVNHKILCLIILLASGLRFIGTFPGYQPFHPDEGISYSSATSMIRNGNIDPLRYDYPALVPLTNLLFFQLFFIPLYWFGYYLIHIPEFLSKTMVFPLSASVYNAAFQSVILGWRDTNALAWGRIITALLGVGSVVFIYLISRKLFNKNTGLIIATLVAVNYRQVLNSHFGLPDIYNSFFLLLALLFQLYLLEKPTFKNYLLSAFFAGLSISVKYQFFCLIPFFLIHLKLSLNNTTLQKKIRSFFSLKAILVPIVAAGVFLILNPYHLVNLEKTMAQVSYSAAKYKAGTMALDVYSYWYLYNIGIGKITSVILLAGVVMMLFSQWKKAIFLLSVSLPFLYMMTYYSAGGYYTRNFVTITPLLLIFAGFAVSQILKLRGKLKYLFILIFIPIIWENLSNALIVPQEYSQTWNYRILMPWINQNIPEGSKIAAHSSVFFPNKEYTRLPYNFVPAFSMDEFKEEGADFAIANLDIVTDDFYWWIGEIKLFGLWEKPIDILEQTYPAMTIRELTQSSVFSVINPWQAPDSDYIVAKIPRYKIIGKEKVLTYSFNEGVGGWHKSGVSGGNDKNLIYKDGSLIIIGGGGSPNSHWESVPININNYQGLVVETKMKSELIAQNIRDGYVFVSFYSSLEDAKSTVNRLGIRLSSRNNNFGDWVKKDLVTILPSGTQYITLGFQSYGAADSEVLLDELTVYKAAVEVDYQGMTIKPFYLDPDILFPFSHGML